MASLVVRRYAAILIVVGISALAACGSQPVTGPPYFRIVSGSENQPFETLLTSYAQSQGKPIEIVYKGSVDIMRELQWGA